MCLCASLGVSMFFSSVFLPYPVLSFPFLSFPFLALPCLALPFLFFPFLSLPCLSFPFCLFLMTMLQKAAMRETWYASTSMPNAPGDLRVPPCRLTRGSAPPRWRFLLQCHRGPMEEKFQHEYRSIGLHWSKWCLTKNFVNT